LSGLRCRSLFVNRRVGLRRLCGRHLLGRRSGRLLGVRSRVLFVDVGQCLFKLCSWHLSSRHGGCQLWIMRRGELLWWRCLNLPWLRGRAFLGSLTRNRLFELPLRHLFGRWGKLLFGLRGWLLSRRHGRYCLRRLPRWDLCGQRVFRVFRVRSWDLLCGGGRCLLFLRGGNLPAGHWRDGLFGLRCRRLLCSRGRFMLFLLGGHFCDDHKRHELLRMLRRHLLGCRGERLFYLHRRPILFIWRCRLRFLRSRNVSIKHWFRSVHLVFNRPIFVSYWLEYLFQLSGRNIFSCSICDFMFSLRRRHHCPSRC
jgi:hypothetical protein